MTTTKCCDLCDTALEFEHDGQLIAFTAHTLEWCRATTKQRIANLEHGLKAKDETWAAAFAHLRKKIDRLLASNGTPMLTERESALDHYARTGERMYVLRSHEERNGRPQRAPWR